jgi:opacity protein-like surface antigen
VTEVRCQPNRLRPFGLPSSTVQFVTSPELAEFDALSVRAIRHVPLFWGSFIVGAGYFIGDWDTLLVADDGFSIHRFEDSSSENGLTATVGLQWDFDAWSLRIEYEWWDVEDADPAQIAFGAHYRF